MINPTCGNSSERLRLSDLFNQRANRLHQVRELVIDTVNFFARSCIWSDISTNFLTSELSSRIDIIDLVFCEKLTGGSWQNSCVIYLSPEQYPDHVFFDRDGELSPSRPILGSCVSSQIDGYVS